MTRWSTEKFYDSETLYDTVMVYTRHYPYVQTNRMNTNSERLWGHIGSSFITKISLLFEMLIMGDAIHVWGQGVLH